MRPWLFPRSDPFVGQLLSFTTFFIGFVARPIGAAIFGHFGDRVGRKALLITTMMLMGLSTVVVVRWGVFWFGLSLSIVVGVENRDRCRVFPHVVSSDSGLYGNVTMNFAPERMPALPLQKLIRSSPCSA